MKGQVSAGVLLYRGSGPDLEVLIAHPGGPYWSNKDDGAWSIPKGLVEDGEDPLRTAVREFEEETGCPLDDHAVWHLGDVTLKSGKHVIAFAAPGECVAESLVSNRFEVEWPPRSGVVRSFPEIDRIEWVRPEVARRKLNPAQAPLVEILLDAVSDP